ncbi:MAG: anti-sigma regulatory factor [Herpetosiphonaceae bacterium]|nr:MAG: anti-sigma regulatory factor [Herpetosiphonaceae bacterium]
MNRVEVNIPSDLIFERVIRASAAELAAQMGFAPERIEDLKLALSEAVTNAIEHGSAPAGSSSVEVSFTLDHEKLEVTIRDHGRGVEQLNFNRRVVEEENLDAGYLRGFGLYLISELVDQYEVESSPNGTVMTLRIFRTHSS